MSEATYAGSVRIEFFESSELVPLRERINSFAQRHQIISCQLCVSKHGYTDYFTVLVMYQD